MAWAQDYQPNATGAKTRTNRLVGSISVGSDSYSLPTGTRYSYTDATDEKTFTVWAGETISLGMTQSAGTWMNAFVYIDQDKNGFTAGIGTDGYTPTGDLVSYSFYNNGASSDDSGYNSVGDPISGGNRSTLSLPNIVAPTTPGTYRIRFKYDWCNIDPAGEQETYFGNTFTGHGGEIIDATLIVDYPFEFVESGKPTKWYHVALHPVNKNYISVNASGQATATTSLDGTKNSAWGFVGNPIDGFKLVNAAGKELVFGSPATVADENGTVFKVVKSTHGGSGFALQAPNSNQCLNPQSGLVKSWTLDQGCTVLLEEAVVFDGEGTAASPYLIDSADKLAALRDKVNGGEAYEGVYFKLTSGITLSGEWTAIGNGTRSSKTYSGNAFKGIFDGDDNTISGLTIASTSDKNAAVGLFGVVDGGTVKNLTLNDVNINVANSNLAGAAIGMMLNGATADNITVNGAVTGNDGVGGIVGRLIIDGTIANCINNASVTSSYGGIGGIVGKAYYEDGANTGTFASIENCTNNGTVTAPMYVGGIVGLARANVTDCVNNGEIIASVDLKAESKTGYIGGIVASINGAGTLEGCVNNAEVAGGTQTGGIVGQLMAAGTVSGNENKAKIAGRNHLGGIIGDYSQSSDYTYYNVSIANNTNRGELAATEQCAAIMGCNNIDGFTAMTATGNQSYYYVDGLELFGNPEDMVIDETNKFVVPVAQVGEQTFYTFAEAVAAAQAGSEIKLLADATVEGTQQELPAGIKLTSNGHTINGSIRMLGDLELNGPLTITGGLWVGKTEGTLTATLSGDKLTASYFMFQRGTYTINADIDAVYGYLSFEGTFEVNSTIHTTGANGEVLYINGNVTLNDGAVLDSDNSVWVCNDNAVLTLKPGSKVDSNVKITKSGAKLNIDATGMTAGASANITGTVTNSGNGTIAVVGNDNLEASIVDGKVVLAAKPVAKIGEQGYATLEAAYEAAVNGDVIVLNESVTTFPVIKKAVTFKGGKENAAVEINYALSQNFTAIDGIVRFENLTFNKPLFTEHGGNKPGLSIEFEGCNFNVNSEAGYGILIGTSWSNSVVKGLKVNNCNFKYVGTEFKGGYMLYVQCVNEVTITNNTIDGNNLYRGAIHLGDATEHATVATVSNNTIKNFCRGVMMGNRVVGSSATISGNTFDNINYSDKDSKPAQECAPIFIHSNATAEALQIALTNNEVENCANPMIYSEDTDLIKYYVTEFTGNTVAGAAVELANSYNAPNQIFPVATVNDAEYFTLQDALDAAAAGTGNVTVEILTDVDLTDVDWEPVTVSDPGYPVVTVEGNDKTITGLNDMLFAGTWAGGSGLIIKNLTIANSAIVNDKDDTQGTVGVGAFIGFPQASATITLENCHLKNSSVEGGHWTGGLIGYAAGYAGTDGPVFMNLTIKNCSVTGSTITGKGSAGGIIGHGSGNAWTNVVIEATTVSGNTITSTGSSTNKAGAVMGTIGAAGQPTTVNGVTHTGGMSVSATVAENDVKSNGTVITTIYGRQGTATGMLAVAGGSYDNYPIEEGVAYAAPAAGYKIEANEDGTYGVVVDPAYGKVAKVGDEYFATLQEAINAAQNDETVVLLNTITLADADMVKTEDNRNVMLNISNKSITLDLNENTINIDYNGGQYLFAAVYVADGAGLTVTGNGKIDIAENGINVAYMFWKRGTTGYLTIENGTFHMDDSGDSMVYTNGDEIVTVNGGTFTIDNIDTRPNQFPCIFNAAGQNTANIIVNGGTFNDDVAHQYYPFEVMMPREKALKKSESENLWTVVDAVAYVAEKEGQYINEVGYATLAEAIAAAEAGETVTILAGDFTQNLDVQKAITVAGETDAEGNNLVNFAGKLNITADGATVKNINVNNGGSSAGYINAKNVTVDGCQVVGGNGFRSCYTKGTVTFKNSVITGGTYGIHFDGSADGNIVIDNCTITGWTSFAATITKVTMKDTRFDNGNYNYVRFYQGAELTGCSFNEEMNVDFAVDGVEVTVADCTVDGDRTVEDLFEGKDIANSSITVDGVKLARIAKIGDEYYETITAAINAAANGATVEILAGEHSEYVAPWKTDTQHKTEKSITLVGAADFATVLTGGMYLGYDDSQCREHNIVVKGIAFQGKGLTVACQQNVTIEDNKFTNITEGGAIAVIGKDINSVVKNNVIENVASIGIELRNTLTATVEGNTISGTGHNALQITSQVGSTASTATVLNNTMSDWGVNGEGRAMRFEGIVTATVNGNVMTHTAAPEEFAKITNTTTLDASANYWNGVSPMTSGMFTGVEGDPIAVLKNYYTDAEKTNLVEFSAAGSAARIGSAYFETLAAAITAAQANDVITFLTNINESVTVNKSVTIDGADKTLTGKITTKGSGATLKITIKNITFDGNNQEYDYAVRADNNSKLVIESCSADNYSYGFLYANKTNDQILVKDVTVKNANYGAHLVSINKATFENVTVMDGKYGVMIQNQGSRNVVFNNCTMTNVETPLHVWEKGTANITFAFEGTNRMGVEQLSSSQYAVYKNAAMVGTTVYGNLNDAAAAAAADGTVTLLGNMAIESDLNNAAEGLCNIAADAQVTIDLNGKTIDVTDKSAGNFIVFYNYGDLTIKNGTVNLVAENNRAWNAQSTIILNRGGELTIESGTYKHLGGTDMAFALDNSGNSFGDAYATIVAGTLESTYTAIRNRMADPTLNGNPGNGTAELTIQGGLIKGVKRGVWGQITNASSDFLGSLTVTGGTIEATDAIRMDADSHENITVDISANAVIKGNLAGDYADYNVTGGTFYNEVEEGYLAWGYQLVGDAAPYTVAYTGKVSELTLVDGEFTEFVNEQELTVGTLTYERTLPAAGNWYPLYVPFEVPLEELTALGYEAAFFYDVHFEVLAGGEIDPTSAPDVHLIKIKEGTLKANFPYVIRANASADLNLSLVLENTTLFTTAASAMNSVESGSTINRFIFAGTYKKAKPEELTGDANVPCYVISSRGTFGKLNANTSLSPFRVYMSIIAKDGSPIILNDVAAESISMRVIGEENEDGTTFIYDVEMDGEHTSDYIYDLQGRRVLEPQKGGLYIVNGKKVVF